MRWWFWLCLGGLIVTAAVAAVWIGSLYWLPYASALVSMIGTVLLINGGETNEETWRRVRAAAGAVPRTVRVGLLLCLLALMVYAVYFHSIAEEQPEVGRRWMITLSGIIVGAAVTAVAYAAGRPQRSRAGGLAATIIVGVLLIAGAAVCLHPAVDTFYDERAVHDELIGRYGARSWARHVLAVNAYHGEYVVYLNTDDAAVVLAACEDANVLAAERHRRATLVMYRDGRSQTLMKC